MRKRKHKFTFETWKRKVDEEIKKQTGGWLDSGGIPDWDYYTAWQENLTPNQAAKEAIINAKTY